MSNLAIGFIVAGSAFGYVFIGMVVCALIGKSEEAYDLNVLGGVCWPAVVPVMLVVLGAARMYKIAEVLSESVHEWATRPKTLKIRVPTATARRKESK